MKLISEKEIKYNHKCYTDETHEHWFYTPERIAQAQKEADEGQVKELFEEIEKVYGRSFGNNRIFIGIIPTEDWQALKERWINGS